MSDNNLSVLGRVNSLVAKVKEEAETDNPREILDGITQVLELNKATPFGMFSNSELELVAAALRREIHEVVGLTNVDANKIIAALGGSEVEVLNGVSREQLEAELYRRMGMPTSNAVQPLLVPSTAPSSNGTAPLSTTEAEGDKSKVAMACGGLLVGVFGIFPAIPLAAFMPTGLAKLGLYLFSVTVFAFIGGGLGKVGAALVKNHKKGGIKKDDLRQIIAMFVGGFLGFLVALMVASSVVAKLTPSAPTIVGIWGLSLFLLIVGFALGGRSLFGKKTSRSSNNS